VHEEGITGKHGGSDKEAVPPQLQRPDPEEYGIYGNSDSGDHAASSSVIPKLGDQLENFLDFRFLVGHVVTAQGVVDAGLDVVLENVFLDFLEGADDGAELDEDVNAVAFLVDHLFYAPHLSLYAVEA